MKIIILIILSISLLNKNSFSEIIDEIRIDGNQRVSDETILCFQVAVNDEVNQKNKSYFKNLLISLIMSQ